RKLLEELLQFGRALAFGGGLDVVQHEYFVEPDLEVRDQVFAQERRHAPLHRPADRRVARRRRPDSVVMLVVARRLGQTDVAALERRADPVPKSADLHAGTSLY